MTDLICHELDAASQLVRSIKLARCEPGTDRPLYFCAADCAESAAAHWDIQDQDRHGPAYLVQLNGLRRTIRVDGFGGDTGPRIFVVTTRAQLVHEVRLPDGGKVW